MNRTSFKKQLEVFASKEKMQTGLKVAGFKTQKVIWAVIRTALIMGISFVILYPLIIKLSVSLMSPSDMSDVTVRWMAKNPTFDNFKFAVKVMAFWQSLFNTATLSVLCTVLQIISCTMASYAFAKLRYPFCKIVYVLIIFTLVVPPQTYMIAMYSQFRFFDPFGLVTLITGKQGLMDTLWPMLIKSAFATGIRNGLYVYIMTQFFRNIPVELQEAAHVDGASHFRTFRSIMIPNAVPAIVTICVFSIVWQWNDDFYSTLFTPSMDFLSSNLYNIEGMINKINEKLFSNSGLASVTKNAAALITSLPLLILFIFVQRFFIENVERSGIVG